jgi:prepilin-type N-terminal cleavage/methylation domain-containing protein
MSAARRRAQSGTTLVEVLVAMMIIGLALVFIVGTFSTALLDSTLTKRNTAVEAVVQYELDQVAGSQFAGSPSNYSECFATESTAAPQILGNFQDPCPGQYTLRADVSWAPGSTSTSQVWTIVVVAWPGAGAVGTPVSTYKVNR